MPIPVSAGSFARCVHFVCAQTCLDLRLFRLRVVDCHKTGRDEGFVEFRVDVVVNCFTVARVGSRLVYFDLEPPLAGRRKSFP